jgi:hypothetical protein
MNVTRALGKFFRSRRILSRGCSQTKNSASPVVWSTIRRYAHSRDLVDCGLLPRRGTWGCYWFVAGLPEREVIDAVIKRLPTIPAALGERLDRGQRVIEVGDNVFHIFNSH